MKKVFLFLAMLFAIGFAEAQISVQKTQGSSEVLWKSAGNRTRLVCFTLSSGQRYLVLTLLTNNQFDKPMVIYLGDKENAKASLSTLKSLSFEAQGLYHLKDDKGKPFTFYRDSFGQYVIRKEGFAGDAFTTAAQISKMITVLSD